MRFATLWLAIACLTVATWALDPSFATAPALVLKPIAPPGHQKEHVHTLHPRMDGKHFWTPHGQALDPEMATMFAEANITYQHPAVIIPHSDLIRYTFCLNNGIEIGFQSAAAYEYAKTHWTVEQGGKFLLVTESLHCNAADVGNHVYWLASEFQHRDEDKVITAIAEEVGLNKAYNDVQIAWGSTNPHNEPLGGAGTDFRGHAHGLETAPRRRGPPPGASKESLAKRASVPALFQPWYANVPQTNGTQLVYSSAMVTPQYYFTPSAGMTISPSDRFTVITLAPSAGSNTTGYLVYGYGGQSANQIQPNAYYAITNPARPLAPGYNLLPVAQGSCPVPLVSYIFKEPATALSAPQAPSSRAGFNVTAWAVAAGLGSPLGSNLISVVNGQYPPSCTLPPSSSSSSMVRSSSISSKIQSSVKSSVSSSVGSSSSTIKSSIPSSSARSLSASLSSTTVKSTSSSNNRSSSALSTFPSKSSIIASSYSIRPISSSSAPRNSSSASVRSTSSASISSASSLRNVTLPSASSMRNVTLPTSSSVRNVTSSSSIYASASASVIPVSNSCSNPPDTYLGVAAAPCGSGFDAAKDAKIGYYDLTTAGDVNTFIGKTLATRRSMSKRAWYDSVENFFVKGADAVADYAKQAAEAAARLAEELYNKAKDGFNDAVDAIKNTLGKPISAPLNQNLPLNYHPGNLVDSPWGTADAILIYSTNKTKGAGGDSGLIGEIDVFCKDCGFSGSATIYGELAFSIIPAELTALNIGVKGDLSTTVALGIEASVRYQKIWTKSLVFEYPPDISLAVADMFTLGFLLKADAIVNFVTKLEGEVLIGCSVDIDGFDASVDLLSGSAHQSGWTPKFNFDPSKDFQASAEITASLAFSLPVEFIFGIQIIPIDFDKTVGIRNTPVLSASTMLQVGTSGSTTGGTCPNGFSYNVGFVNSLDYDKGGDWESIDQYTHTFADGCFAIPGLPHASSSSSTAPTTSTTSLVASHISSTTSTYSVTATSSRASLSVSTSSAHSATSSASPTSASSAAAPSSTFPISPNSPYQYGDVEWAFFQNQFAIDYIARDAGKAGVPAATGINCALSCQADSTCTAASFTTPYDLCYHLTADFSQYELADFTGGKTGAQTFFTTSCSVLAQIQPDWTSCMRFFPPPPPGTYFVDPASPLQQIDQEEWASYPGFTATGLTTNILTTDDNPVTIEPWGDLKVAECARICEHTTGCQVTDWQSFGNSVLCMGLFGTGQDLGLLDLAPTTNAAESIVFRATCEEMGGFFPTHLQDCNRFFPQSVSDSIFAEAGPSPQHLGNGPAWSWYGDGTFITATPPDNGAPEVHLPENLATGFSPASVTDCITACQSLSGANVAGVVFIPSEKHCTCTIGRIDTDTIAVSRPRTYRSPFAPLPVEMVVFKDCVTTTGLRGDWGRLTCENYIPTNLQIYGIATSSPLQGPAPGIPEWGFLRDYTFRTDYTVQTFIVSKCKDIFCCASAAQLYDYYAADWNYQTNQCTIFRHYNFLGTQIPDMVYAVADSAVTHAVVLLTSCSDFTANMDAFDKSQFTEYWQPCKAWYQPAFNVGTKRDQAPGRLALDPRDDGSNVTAGLQAALGVSTILNANITAGLAQAKQAAAAAAPNTVSIRDLTGTYQLAPQSNGNLLLTNAGSVSFAFAVDKSGVVYGDGASAAFLYDLSEMNAFGVARFRYKTLDSVAKSSRFVTLAPINYDHSSSTPGVYVAIDVTGQMFAPIVCSIAGETKMFLARNVTAGIATLQRPDLQVVVTGGPATACAVVGLITTGQSGV